MRPKIDRPCPLKTLTISSQASFHCSHCSKSVYHLDRMTDAERRALVSSCGMDEVCVMYRVKQGLKVAATAGMFLMSASGYAVSVDGIDNLGNNTHPAEVKVCDDEKTAIVSPLFDNTSETEGEGLVEMEWVIVGGVSDIQSTEGYAMTEDTESLELIPVVFDDSE